MKAVLMGAGFCGAFPASGGLSYREMIARAAAMAYQDAGITAEQLDGAVSVEEDFVSGYSIADEYVPDQLGVQRKAVYTVCGDFLHGLCSAAMQIETGRYRRLVVEAYSKASNMLTKGELQHFAYDPVWNRLGVSPHWLGGIEMQRMLQCGCRTVDEVVDVVVRNRSRALGHPMAPYGAVLGPREVLQSRPIAEPLTEAMIARPADAAVVMVLGCEDVAGTARKPLRLAGLGWCSGSSVTEWRDHDRSEGTALAARAAYAEAGIADPAGAFDVAYVSDLLAHRQLMHLEAMGLANQPAERVNPDGGSLAGGDLFEANGGARLFDAVRQLRGEAGAHQVAGARRAVVQGWRGLPTDSCAVVVVEA